MVQACAEVEMVQACAEVEMVQACAEVEMVQDCAVGRAASRICRERHDREVGDY
jgi:hypothetical protein